MGKRTMSSCWRQFDKMSQSYLHETKPRDEVMEDLKVLTGKANNDDIGGALATLFVKPYISAPVNVEFTMEMPGDEIPEWTTRFDSQAACIYVHPLAMFRFIENIRTVDLDDPEYEDFIRKRLWSFLNEIGKLPEISILFLLVLQRVAYMLEIAHLEKRGGVIEVAEGESYHTLLWAFKEVENFTRRTSGLNVRAHYGISWYESDWITGR